MTRGKYHITRHGFALSKPRLFSSYRKQTRERNQESNIDDLIAMWAFIFILGFLLWPKK